MLCLFNRSVSYHDSRKYDTCNLCYSVNIRLILYFQHEQYQLNIVVTWPACCPAITVYISSAC